jgi:hypothetical protein
VSLATTTAGFLVGAAVGMTGVGGGALMTPLLLLIFGYAPATAVGTDLWFAALTKIVGGGVHQSRGGVDWVVLRRMFIGSIPATLLTLWWMNATRTNATTQGTIVHALGWVLLVTSVAMLLRARIQAFALSLRTNAAQAFKAAQPVLTVIAGGILGVLVPLTSVGAGSLGTVMILYIYPVRMTPARLAGTDIVHAIPIALLAGAGHLLMGNVQLPLLGGLLLGSIPGVIIGALVAHRAPEAIMRAVIAFILAIVALKLLVS